MSHHHDDHDDHGGLHRDLLATGVAMDRRGVLRLGARFGAAFSAIQLVGCSNSPTSPTMVPRSAHSAMDHLDGYQRPGSRTT